jgi:hypothetical protein
MRMRALLVPVITSCTAATAPAFADFGVLNYGGNNIPFTVGTGGGANIGNDGYTFSNHSTGPDTVTIGLKAIAWQGANFDLVNDVTYSSVVGGGSWLNRDANGAYLAATGAATETRDGNGNIVSYSGATRARWSFVWNASLNGVRPASGLFNLRMIVDGPAAGELSMDLGDLNGNFSVATDPKWQNAWNPGFSFLSSAGSVFDYGNWNIKLRVFDASVGNGYSSLVGEQAINVLAVPSPGAFALLGIAGFTSRRRRA